MCGPLKPLEISLKVVPELPLVVPVGKLPPTVGEESEKRREKRKRESEREREKREKRQKRKKRSKRKKREKRKKKRKRKNKKSREKNNKNSGRPSWDDLGSFWGVLERVLGLVGGLGAHPGRSWRPLRGSWRPLGASWRPFGATWAVLGRYGSPFVVLSSTVPCEEGRPGSRKSLWAYACRCFRAFRTCEEGVKTRTKRVPASSLRVRWGREGETEPPPPRAFWLTRHHEKAATVSI